MKRSEVMSDLSKRQQDIKDHLGATPLKPSVSAPKLQGLPTPPLPATSSPTSHLVHPKDLNVGNQVLLGGSAYTVMGPWNPDTGKIDLFKAGVPSSGVAYNAGGDSKNNANASMMKLEPGHPLYVQPVPPSVSSPTHAILPAKPAGVSSQHFAEFLGGHETGHAHGKEMAANGKTVTQIKAAAAPHYANAKKLTANGHHAAAAHETGQAKGLLVAAKEHKDAGGPVGGVKSSVSKPQSTTVQAKHLKAGDIVETPSGAHIVLDGSGIPSGMAPGSMGGHQILQDGTVTTPPINVPASQGGTTPITKLTSAHPLSQLQVASGTHLSITHDDANSSSIPAPGYSVKHGKLADLTPSQKKAYDSSYLKGYNEAAQALKQPSVKPGDVYAASQVSAGQVFQQPVGSVKASELAGLAKGAHQAAYEASMGQTPTKKTEGFTPGGVSTFSSGGYTNTQVDATPITGATMTYTVPPGAEWKNGPVAQKSVPYSSTEAHAIASWTGYYRNAGIGPANFIAELNRIWTHSSPTPIQGAGAQLARSVLSAVSKHATPSKHPVFRGTMIPRALLEKAMAQGRISLPTESWSTSQPFAEVWTGHSAQVKNGIPHVPVVYHMAAGGYTSNIRAVSHHPSEAETLTGGNMQVVSLTFKNGQYHLFVRQMPFTGKTSPEGNKYFQ